MIELGLSSVFYFFYAYEVRKNKIKTLSCDQHYPALTILHDLVLVYNFSLYFQIYPL